jgi:hypothetical protein
MRIDNCVARTLFSSFHTGARSTDENNTKILGAQIGNCESTASHGPHERRVVARHRSPHGFQVGDGGIENLPKLKGQNQLPKVIQGVVGAQWC